MKLRKKIITAGDIYGKRKKSNKRRKNQEKNKI